MRTFSFSSFCDALRRRCWKRENGKKLKTDCGMLHHTSMLISFVSFAFASVAFLPPVGLTLIYHSFSRTTGAKRGGGGGSGASDHFVNRNNNNNNIFQVLNEWKYLDFEYPSYTQRQAAISNGDFVPENNLPLGIDVHDNRLFVTTPRWKDGVPASFGYIPYPPTETSPAIRPYPDWESHSNTRQVDCDKLISVYRSSIDQCQRLWLIDSGIVNATVNLNQICPPKIVAYDLTSDTKVLQYVLPPEQVKQDSLHSNILIHMPHDSCDDAYALVTDVWRFGLMVYSLKANRSWRVTNYNFNPNPRASNFDIYNLNFQWLDGIFGMSIQPPSAITGAILYFHPMASYKEFSVPMYLLLNQSIWSNGNAQDVAKYFMEEGDRGFMGQSSTSGIDRTGVMFFTQVQRDNVGCWDTAKPYTRRNLDLLLPKDDAKLGTKGLRGLITFPNDLKIDQEPVQGVWVMSNRLPIYLYGTLNYQEINFRILRADVKDAVRQTICDPQVPANFGRRALVELDEGQCF